MGQNTGTCTSICPRSPRFQIRGTSRANDHSDRLCAVRVVGQPHVLFIDSAWSNGPGGPDAKRRSDQAGDD